MLRLRSGRDLLLMFTATGYLVMYLVFSYVDIAWDTRSMISVAIAMAVCSELDRLRADGEPDGAVAADPLTTAAHERPLASCAR
jgi:hypothetical protein